MRAGGAACCWCWYTFDAWAPSSLEVGIILVRDLVQVWAITAPSQPLFPMTRHSLTVLARHSLWQWHRRVWSCLVASSGRLHPFDDPVKRREAIGLLVACDG